MLHAVRMPICLVFSSPHVSISPEAICLCAITLLNATYTVRLLHRSVLLRACLPACSTLRWIRQRMQTAAESPCTAWAVYALSENEKKLAIDVTPFIFRRVKTNAGRLIYCSNLDWFFLWCRFCGRMCVRAWTNALSVYSLVYFYVCVCGSFMSILRLLLLHGNCILVYTKIPYSNHIPRNNKKYFDCTAESVDLLQNKGVGVSQVKPANYFRRLEKLLLTSIFDTSLSSLMM